MQGLQWHRPIGLREVPLCFGVREIGWCSKGWTLNSMSHWGMCRLSQHWQRHNKRNMSSRWNSSTGSFSKHVLDQGLLSLWQLFPEPSQGKDHLLESHTLDQETKFGKMGYKIKKMKEDAGKSGQNIGMGRAWERYELAIYRLPSMCQALC